MEWLMDWNSEFTLALILTFPPGEKEQPGNAGTLPIDGPAKSVTQPRGQRPCNSPSPRGRGPG